MRIYNAGADANELSESGWTALMYAANSATNPNTIQVLAKAKAQINAKDKFGYSALMLAIENNPNPEILKELIKSGANTNDKDCYGKTIYMYAREKNIKPELLSMLIQSGAKAVKYGTLKITEQFDFANLSINNIFFGTVPDKEIYLPIGTHTLTFSKEGYSKVKMTVKIKENSKKSIRYEFKESDKINDGQIASLNLTPIIDENNVEQDANDLISMADAASVPTVYMGFKLGMSKSSVIENLKQINARNIKSGDSEIVADVMSFNQKAKIKLRMGGNKNKLWSIEVKYKNVNQSNFFTISAAVEQKFNIYIPYKSEKESFLQKQSTWGSIDVNVGTGSILHLPIFYITVLWSTKNPEWDWDQRTPELVFEIRSEILREYPETTSFSYVSKPQF